MTASYHAYISYAHQDAAFALWLQRRIETYRIPRPLRAATGRQRLTRLFRDRDELPSASDLGAAIRAALEQSEALIVVCSPAAAQSEWVNEEVRHFRRFGPPDKVFPIIATGEPPGCFPPALRFLLDAQGEVTADEAHPIASDARREGDGRRAALLKLIAGLLGVGFDELRHRDQHRKQRRMAVITAGSVGIAVITATLALMAMNAREDAERHRSQAEALVAFMIGDLRGQLTTLGRLDVLESVGEQAMVYFAGLESTDETDEVLVRRAEALRQIGEVQMQQGRLADAANAFQEAFHLAAELAERHPEREDLLFELGQAHFYNGYVRYLWAHHDRARQSFEEYRAIAETLLARHGDEPRYRLELAYAYSNLGTLEMQAGNLDTAAQHFTAAVALNEQLLDDQPDDPALMGDLAGGYSWLGAVAAAQGQIRPAIDWYRREMTLRQRLLGDGEDWSAMALAAVSHQLLGFQLFLAGSAEEAIEQLRASLQMADRLAEHDPNNLTWQRTLGVGELTLARIQLGRGDLPNAQRHASAAVATLVRLSAADPSNVGWRRDHATALLVQGQALRSRDDATAAGYLAQGARLAEEIVRDDSAAQSFWLLGVTALSRGDLEAAAGRADAAEEHWLAALAALEQATAGSREAQVVAALAEALERTGAGDRALALHESLNRAGLRGTTVVGSAIAQASATSAPAEP